MPPKMAYTSVIGRVIPALTMWTVGRVLSLPSVQKRTKALDQSAHKKKERVVASVRRAGKNAASNGVWAAASAAAFALSIGLMAKATKKK